MHLRLSDDRPWPLERPRIMGILNVTPDSFSDGGAHNDPAAAVAHAQAMADAGADVIDVGGESTRPGSQRVGADDQIRRVVPVIRELRALPGDVLISVDTTRAAVAEAALDAGADLINDVSAGRDDDTMFDLAARRNAPVVLMHMLGAPATMQQDPNYDDVVAEIEAFLVQRAQAAQAAGVARDRIMIDPGIGFGKTKPHNLALLHALGRFVATGYPVLLGASRKRFMGAICNPRPGSRVLPRDDGLTDPTTTIKPCELVGATCATTVMGVLSGISMFRVHDVQANRQAADVAWAIVRNPAV
ncbi:MAG: dihydropteroate synthase [Phycisphaeraceae bacterium]|jgi:dihydropteroate synthase|nr:dihydropteroate synthase [Phycisphaeraceae bacterium]